MRKILNIGGNDVAFECNAVTSILYKNEFNKNYFGEMLKLTKAIDTLQNPKDASNEDLENVDIDVISRLAWACAKTADRETKSYIDWLYENKDFNIMDHGTKVADLIYKNFETKKK